MTDQRWTYPPELADALLTFGLAPTSDTSPLLVRDALNDLYRFEIRRLKQRLLDGHVAKADYTPEVVLLRKKYWPLSLQPGHWEKICEQRQSEI
jgi:hypothetical protein